MKDWKKALALAFLVTLTAANLMLAPMNVWACGCTDAGGASCTGNCCYTQGGGCACYDSGTPACPR